MLTHINDSEGHMDSNVRVNTGPHAVVRVGVIGLLIVAVAACSGTNKPETQQDNDVPETVAGIESENISAFGSTESASFVITDERNALRVTKFDGSGDQRSAEIPLRGTLAGSPSVSTNADTLVLTAVICEDEIGNEESGPSCSSNGELVLPTPMTVFVVHADDLEFKEAVPPRDLAPSEMLLSTAIATSTGVAFELRGPGSEAGRIQTINGTETYIADPVSGRAVFTTCELESGTFGASAELEKDSSGEERFSLRRYWMLEPGTETWKTVQIEASAAEADGLKYSVCVGDSVYFDLFEADAGTLGVTRPPTWDIETIERFESRISLNALLGTNLAVINTFGSPATGADSARYVLRPGSDELEKLADVFGTRGSKDFVTASGDLSIGLTHNPNAESKSALSVIVGST